MSNECLSVYDFLNSSFTNAIHCCLQNQSRPMFDLDIIGRLKQYCTVKFFCGRQTGLTTLSLKISQQIFKKSLFVFPNHSMADSFCDVLKNNFDLIYPPCCCTIQNLKTVKGATFDSIFVDNASLMSESQINEIYDLATNSVLKQINNLFCIILMA